MTSWASVLGFDTVMVGMVVVIVGVVDGAATQREMRMAATHHGSQILLLNVAEVVVLLVVVVLLLRLLRAQIRAAGRVLQQRHRIRLLAEAEHRQVGIRRGGSLLHQILQLVRLLVAGAAAIVVRLVVVVVVRMRRHALVRLPDRLLLLVLEAFLAPQVTAIFEHVARLRVQRPERALARLVGGAGHLDEAVVEGERMPDRVLPPLLVLPVEREQVHDELVDLGQGEHFGGRILDGHRDQRDVRIGRLGVGVGAAV